MPLYELLVIAARHNHLAPITSLATTTSSLILANGGVVRSLDYWGQRNLPQKMKRSGTSALIGDYWTLKFDANPPTLAALNERLRVDPRVLRWTTIKVGSTLKEVSKMDDQTIKFGRKYYSPSDDRPQELFSSSQ